jgi:meso-butanediol dehydrogenase / (S,S)-butanediol dehydrogenase / diacetyl reductase
MSRLKNQVALITGGGRGIGGAIALAYAREGAKIVVVDIDEANANSVVGEILAAGNEAVAFVADVSDTTQSTAMIARAVKHFGRLDLLVNNAGVIRVRSFLNTTPEDWDHIQSINTRGLFFAVQAGARQMLQQTPMAPGRAQGKIINMASIAGRGGRPMLGAYAASKAAVINITQTAALEFAPKINVNSICPGPVDTEMWKQIDSEWSEQQQRPQGSVWQERIRNIPMGRGELTADLMGMAVFLASADSDYITGQSFHVDGGIVPH